MSELRTTHIASGEHHLLTVCGEPWESWQAPRGYEGKTLPSRKTAKPYDQFRLCEPCRLQAVRT